MASLKMLTVAGSAVLLGVGAAGAADLALAPPPVPVPVVQDFSGWYLRGDIGFANYRVKDPSYNFGTDQPPVSSQIFNKEFETGGIFGIGVGYQFNNWLRFDATGEYRSAATLHIFEANTFQGGNILPEHNTMVLSSWVAMVNGYVDLGTWWCVTPFVGAGVGFANVHVGGYEDFVIAGSQGGGYVNNSNQYAAGYDQWNFAWALHAGLAYKVSPNFTVELAYRYLNLGDAQTALIYGFTGAATNSNRYDLKTIDSHDVKLGVRWLLSPPEPVYAPPLIRKG